MQAVRCLVVAGLAALALSAQDSSLVRLTEAEAKKAAVSKVDPEYPDMARKMHLAGRVIVNIFIDEEGKVEKVAPVSGNQLLTGATVSAVKKWKFTPAEKKQVTTLAFDFKL